MRGTDWIATFPAIFNESQRDVLAQVERSGYEKALQDAAKCAASYALEDEAQDSICREIAREISAIPAVRP